jgi:hypothetical protein
VEGDCGWENTSAELPLHAGAAVPFQLGLLKTDPALGCCSVDFLRHFALDGLWLPAFQILWGTADFLQAPYARRFTPDEVRGYPGWLRWLLLLGSNFQRRVGIFMILAGIGQATLRLLRPHLFGEM